MEIVAVNYVTCGCGRQVDTDRPWATCRCGNSFWVGVA